MKIICIGRNYADHAKEMNSPTPVNPIFFLKPETALIPKKSPFFLPDFTQDLHYECELVFKICKVGKNISEKFAPNYYQEVGLGIDFTARDLQQQCKEKGLPWEIAKAFDNSAKISDTFLPLADLNLNDLSFKLTKNDQVVQEGNTHEMIFNINQLIAYVSQFITLKVGDLIYTGTPAGVGPIQIGDVLNGYIGEKQMFTLSVK